MSGYSDRLANKLKLQPKDPLPPLSSDKQAYISYLEVQLERAAKSATTVQSYTERFEEIQEQIVGFEEKLMHFTKVLKMEHEYLESQEGDINSLKVKFENLSGFFDSATTRLATLDQVTEYLPQLSKVQSFEDRLRQVEDKLQAGAIFSENQEAKRLANYEAFVRAVDSALKEEETKLNTALKKTVEQIDEKQRQFQLQVETALEQHSKTITADMRRFESKSDRPKSPVNTDLFTSLSQRLEVNTMQEIEGEVRGSLRNTHAEDLKAISEAAWNAEQTCNRLAEDTLDRLSRMDQKIGELVRTRGEVKADDIEERLQMRIDSTAEKTAELMRKYLETQRTMQLQMKQFGITLKRMELLDGHSLSSPHKSHLSMPSFSDKKVKEDDHASPRFPAEESKVAKRSTSVPHVRRPAKSPKGRSMSNTPPTKSPASPIHASTLKSRAMDASIKKKLKELKSKEKTEQSFTKTPDKQKRHRKSEARRNDRLDQLYKEYTAKYQTAQS